jgi:CDP-diacylglycerol--glycerol-3-phosphate 3-phosphatidyltransferase
MVNLPNSVTAVRILLIPVFMFFLLTPNLQPLGSYVAAAIFSLAALTDTIDGYLARFQKQVTAMGQFLDPIADKLLVSAALVSLVELARISAWVALLIIAREFAVSGLRLAAIAEKEVIVASKWGKIKTISQIIAVIAIILQPPVELWGVSVASGLLALAVILTVISGVDYFFKSWRVLTR